MGCFNHQLDKQVEGGETCCETKSNPTCSFFQNRSRTLDSQWLEPFFVCKQGSWCSQFLFLCSKIFTKPCLPRKNHAPVQPRTYEKIYREAWENYGKIHGRWNCLQVMLGGGHINADMQQFLECDKKARIHQKHILGVPWQVRFLYFCSWKQSGSSFLCSTGWCLGLRWFQRFVLFGKRTCWMHCWESNGALIWGDYSPVWTPVACQEDKQARKKRLKQQRLSLLRIDDLFFKRGHLLSCSSWRMTRSRSESSTLWIVAGHFLLFYSKGCATSIWNACSLHPKWFEQILV